MKRFFAIVVACVSLSVSPLIANDRIEHDYQVLDRDTSYAMGMIMAEFFFNNGFPYLQYDYDAYRDGFRAYNEATETRITIDQATDLFYVLADQIQAQQDEDRWIQGQQNIIDSEAFLAENGRRPGVRTTASGLQYEVLQQGYGNRPGADDYIIAHYEGMLLDGSVFESSYWYGEPIEFNLEWVIDGWSEGLQLMNVGSIYRLYIPYDLAYGAEGGGPIPPFSTLIFDVELLEIIR